jgi:lactoylglutathione lyase
MEDGIRLTKLYNVLVSLNYSTVMIKSQFKYTILYVENVVKTIEFYEKSFGLERGFVTPEADYGEVNTGNTTLSFTNLELSSSNVKSGFAQSSLSQKPFGIELAFVTEDIIGTLKQAIAAGATVVEEIETKSWGQQVGYLRDPNGFLLEICTPMVS